ncbi:hypothetical protein [Kitasatospora sp. NPDC004289]
MPLIGTQLSVSLSTLLTGVAALTGQAPRQPVAYQQTLNLGSGTGAGQVDKLWVATRTIAASGTDDLDLAGTLTDAFGAVFTLARVKGIIVAASSANTNVVQVGGAASNAFVNWVADATDKVVLRPGGFMAVAAPDATGYPVTAGTGDLLRITNGGAGTSVTYDICVLGASA